MTVCSERKYCMYSGICCICLARLLPNSSFLSAFGSSPLSPKERSLLLSRLPFPRSLPALPKPGSPFEAVCDGCETQCLNCSFDEPFLEPTCTAVLEHANSSGGNTTIETLSVEPGYWRATAVSPFVFDCYNPDACVGGLTGSTSYCLGGYEGPCECDATCLHVRR